MSPSSPSTSKSNPKLRNKKTKNKKKRKKSKPKAAAAETRNWLELPPDITTTILLKLGAIEILEVAQKVCTAWRRICKDPAMWSSIDMRNPGDLHAMPYDLEKMAMHAVDRSGGQLVAINLEYFATDDLLRYITDRTCQLRRLRFFSCYDISDEGLSEVAEKLPLLEELHIYFGNISEEGIKAIGRACPLLKSFKLNDRGYRDPDFEYDDAALAVAQNMPQLRHLQLFGNQMSNNGLQAILDGCPHLESLDLRQCFNVSLVGNLGKILSERIKDLRRPNDSTEDCEFNCLVDDDDSYDEQYPYGCSDLEYITDDEYDNYGFSGASDDGASDDGGDPYLHFLPSLQ